MGSRVAKNPIEIPTGVEFKLDGQKVTVKSKNEQLVHQVHPEIKITHEGNIVKVAATKTSKEADALAGTTRAIVNNMVNGVHNGFSKKLVLVGVGYRAKAQGKTLNLTLGLSHPVNIAMPEGVTVETPSNTEIILKGANKQQISQVAANIRAMRPPEPYKGKGIRYENEQIIMKEGKKK